jgi:hypothetical protein
MLEAQGGKNFEAHQPSVLNSEMQRSRVMPSLRGLEEKN